MSIKITPAWRTNFEHFSIATEFIHSHMLKETAGLMVKLINVLHDGNEFRTYIECYKKITDLMLYNGEIRMIESGFNFCILYGRVYIVPYGMNSVMPTELPEYLEDYHYQNASDRPENIPESEWRERYETWAGLISAGMLDTRLFHRHIVTGRDYPHWRDLTSACVDMIWGEEE